jgi:hypothetical protein
VRRTALAVLLAALVPSVAGCSSDSTATTGVPTCSVGSTGTASNAVLLMAQSVPTASWVPCVRTVLPTGWSYVHLDARNGIATFSFDSDLFGQPAIAVRLEPSCDTSGATPVPSDRDGMTRFERVQQTTPTYIGSRYYVFPGGCITFAFTLSGDSRGEPLALATQVVGAVRRDDLRTQVHDASDGRLSLDPESTSEG